MTSAREVIRFPGAAQQLGIRIGIDGEEVIIVVPLKFAAETLRANERAIDKNRSKCIRHICLKGAPRSEDAPFDPGPPQTDQYTFTSTISGFALSTIAAGR